MKFTAFSTHDQPARAGAKAPRQEDDDGIMAVSEWVRKQLGFCPDAVQSRVLDSSTKRGILNCSRQWGKSTTAAAKAVHRAVTRAGSLTLVVSPTARQSGEFVLKAATLVRPLGIATKGDGRNEISLALPNGSRIVGLPGTEGTVRGFSSVSLILIDEAARVPDAMYKAVRPMLAVSDGDLWLMSTPYGSRGFFYEAWSEGGEEWERVRVTAAECGRIRPEFLKGEMVALGDRDYRQEYCCEFGAVEGAVFSPEMLAKAFRDDIEPLKL